MSKNERTHGEQMATMGELSSLYQVRIFIDKKITKLETIRELDNIKKEESENVK